MCSSREISEMYRAGGTLGAGMGTCALQEMGNTDLVSVTVVISLEIKAKEKACVSNCILHGLTVLRRIFGARDPFNYKINSTDTLSTKSFHPHNFFPTFHSQDSKFFFMETAN